MKKNVLEYLEDTASRYGGQCAYKDKTQRFTFREVLKLSRAVGTAVAGLKAYGCPVAVFMEKSAAMIIGFLGIVSGGCCYCPLDVAMPEERLNKILSVLDPAAVITSPSQREKLTRLTFSCPVYEFDCLCQTIENPDLLEAVRRRGVDTDPLYILFTSGSTGVPKGVAVSHRVMINNMEWLEEHYDFNHEDVWGNQVPLYFDVSDHDVYCPLKFGCETVMIPTEYFTFPVKLMAFLNEERVTGIFWVPFALCAVANLRALEAEVPQYLKYIFFAGEVMPVKQLNYWRRYIPDARYVNMYGPTETYVCSYYDVNRDFGDDEALPIGLPCKNVDILVLDGENRQILPGDKSQGELCVRGCALALGYYNDPDRTKERFVQNPLNSHFPERIYRTGDLVSYNKLGELLYHGRLDFQIKRLGYRIELGEIEAAAGNVSEIEECACVYDSVKQRILFVYSGGRLEKRELARQLSGKVPQYMMPNQYIYMDKIPRNSNGKIDRKRLKELYV